MAMTKLPVPGPPTPALLRAPDLARLWSQAAPGAELHLATLEAPPGRGFLPAQRAAYWFYGRHGETYVLLPPDGHGFVVAVHRAG